MKKITPLIGLLFGLFLSLSIYVDQTYVEILKLKLHDNEPKPKVIS